MVKNHTIERMKIDLEMFLPLLLIKQVESFRNSRTLTSVLARKFDMISIVNIINKLTEAKFLEEKGSGNTSFVVTKLGEDYIKENMPEAKMMMLDVFPAEEDFIHLLFSEPL